MNFDDVTGELEALAADALDGDEALAVDVLGGLATLAATPPPRGLRDRVLGAALARRPARARPPLAPNDTRDPVTSFTRTADELLATLDALAADDWDRPTVTYPSIRALVAHLIAIEAYFGGQLGLWDEVAPAGEDLDHVGLSQPFIAELRDLPAADLVAQFRARLDAVAARLAELDPDEPARTARFHALEAPLPAILVARTFELWTHHEDVRRATGRPPAPPDPGRLQLMTDVAVGALPVGLALAGTPETRTTARIVLTGPGAGVWEQALDAAGTTPAGAPDVVLVADALEFCRLAARRVAPDDLALHVEGDPALARRILAGAAAFAAD